MITQIKNKIKTILDALVTDETLAGAYRQSWQVDLERELQGKKMPCAILTNTSEISSEVTTNRSNMRTYSLNVQLCFATTMKTSPNLIDEKVEKVMDAFDNQMTIASEDGSQLICYIEPAVSSPYVVTALKNRIFVDLMLRVKKEVVLTFGT